MAEFSDFEEYLVFDDNNNPIGLRQDAPSKIKLEYRKWYLDQEDKKRMYELFHNEWITQQLLSLLIRPVFFTEKFRPYQ